MNLTSIITLLQLVLALLSNPSTANNPQAQVLAQQAMTDATQALVSTPTAQTTSIIETTSTAIVATTTTTTSIAPPPLVFDGQDYANTPTNQNVLNEIQRFENECIANGTPYGQAVGAYIPNQPSCGTAITNEINALEKELTPLLGNSNQIQTISNGTNNSSGASVLQSVPFNSVASVWFQGSMVGILGTTTVNHVVFSYNGTSTTCTGGCMDWSTELTGLQNVTSTIRYPYTIELVGNSWQSESSGEFTIN